MQINYYPWNTELLTEWIATEQSKYPNLDAFEKVIGISSITLFKWRKGQCFDITLEQISAVARYRDWTFTQTVLWLGIKQIHLEELSKSMPLHQLTPEFSISR